MISDFGCSTNKFSEPDIVSFGERFILDKNGQALGYVGNSALGFNSTAIKAPGNFYKNCTCGYNIPNREGTFKGEIFNVSANGFFKCSQSVLIRKYNYG